MVVSLVIVSYPSKLHFPLPVYLLCQYFIFNRCKKDAENNEKMKMKWKLKSRILTASEFRKEKKNKLTIAIEDINSIRL